VGADGASDGSLVPQGSLGGFCKGLSWSGYLNCICSAILGGLLGKRTYGSLVYFPSFLQNTSN
jgi:hypothetical protein